MELDTEIAAAFSLKGRVAVVTGAASGLGREAARLLARAGADVILADRDQANLQTSAEIVREAGRRVSIRPTDVADGDEVKALAQYARRSAGGVDIWINSAGITRWSGVSETTREEAERVVAINMMGTYWGCAAAGRVMQAQGRGGTILNVSSTAGESPVPGLSVYGMTKAAVNQLPRSPLRNLARSACGRMPWSRAGSTRRSTLACIATPRATSTWRSERK